MMIMVTMILMVAIPTLTIGKAVPIAGELHSSNLYPNNNYYLTVGLQSCRYSDKCAIIICLEGSVVCQVNTRLYLVTKVSPDRELSVSLSLSLLSALRGRVLCVTVAEEPRRETLEVSMVSIKGRDILKWDRIKCRHLKNHY